MFLEGHWVSADGGRAVAEHEDGIVYLALSLRNVGAGIAVCQGWTARVGTSRDFPTHAPLEAFRFQTRDLYIPAGDIGMWQGALRHPDDPMRAGLAQVIDARERLLVELLYTDQIGRQRTISRFALVPANETWLVSLTRHWYLDWDGPRPEGLTLAASEVMLRDQEAALRRRDASSDQGAVADVERAESPPVPE